MKDLDHSTKNNNTAVTDLDVERILCILHLSENKKKSKMRKKGSSIFSDITFGTFDG